MLYEQGDCVKIHFFILMLLCLFLSSCIKHSSQQKNEIEQLEQLQPSINSRNDLLDTIIQQEAMLVDIPIPLYDERIISSDHVLHSDTLVFGYKSPLSRAQIIEFFMNQMERYGWKHLVSFNTSSETLLQFESPDRYCSVVIKNSNSTLDHSCIFIYIKKSEHTGSPISSGLG